MSNFNEFEDVILKTFLADTTTESVDASVSLTTEARDIRPRIGFSIQVVATPGLTGTLTLEASNDRETTLVRHFVEIADSAATPASPIKHMWNVKNSYYSFVRARWAPSAGTGTITFTMASI